jgi:hypothetical protein
LFIPPAKCILKAHSLSLAVKGSKKENAPNTAHWFSLTFSESPKLTEPKQDLAAHRWYSERD